MNEIFQWLNQPLPMGITMLIGLVVLWLRVNDNTKEVKSMRALCEDRLKWCINHFENKDTKGGEQ